MSEIRESGLVLSAEDRLVLTAARLRPREDELAELVSLQELDWDLVITRAQTHRVLPLLHRSLALVWNGVPQPAAERIRRVYLQVVVANLIQNEELTRITRAFNEKGIDILPMKGPSLAERVYGDVTLRMFSDLDILVPAGAVLAAKSLLQELGYVPEPMNLEQEKIHLRAGCEYGFTRRRGDSPVNVDLHWAVMVRRIGTMLNAADLWKRSVPSEVGGAVARRMACEDELLYLCIHGWAHCWESLLWMCDIHEFLERYRHSIDWSEFLERAKENKLQRIVGTALWLVERLFRSELPPELADVTRRDQHWRPLAVRVEDSFPGISRPRTNVEEQLFCLRSLPTLGRQATLLGQLLFCPTTADFREFPLPSTATWVYPFVRPIRIAWKILSGRQGL